MYAVGYDGTISRRRGGVWRLLHSGTPSELIAVGASGPDDVWVGGDAGTLLRHRGDGL